MRQHNRVQEHSHAFCELLYGFLHVMLHTRVEMSDHDEIKAVAPQRRRRLLFRKMGTTTLSTTSHSVSPCQRLLLEWVYDQPTVLRFIIHLSPIPHHQSQVEQVKFREQESPVLLLYPNSETQFLRQPCQVFAHFIFIIVCEFVGCERFIH